MNKIRVIDLLNKIANDEEVPKKIKYKNKIYFRSWSDYMGDEPIDEYYFDSEENSWNDELSLKLDDEVEIIEEDKKIEKVNIDFIKEDDTLEDIAHTTFINTGKLADKINEIIDTINELKKGE